jgi:hypothetical protein
VTEFRDGAEEGQHITRRELPILEMWLVNIADDRGVVRRCRMTGRRSHIRAQAPDLSLDEVRQLQQVAAKGMVVPGAIMGSLFGMSFVAWNALVGRHLNPRWFGELSVFLLIPGLWIISDFAVLSRYRPRYARARRRAALELGLCPWCYYRLNGEADPDGLTVCPECGGAWRMRSD